jgi:hypothetical protein
MGARLDTGTIRRNMQLEQTREEASSMCYERYLRRRVEEAEESREIWKDFERTQPVAEPEPPAEVTDLERDEARAETTSSRR